MKFIFTFIFCALCGLSLSAQPPQAFNYQGIARDASGNPLGNKNISLRISIMEDALPGTEVYKENHYVLTNGLGLFSIEIGHGSSQIGLFSDIKWGQNDHYIQVEMDVTGGNDFVYLGIAQLLSVPYALYAGNSTGGGNSQWLDNSKGINYNLGKVGIGTDAPTHKLTIVGNDPVLDDRIYFHMKNNSTSNRSVVALTMEAGLSGAVTSLGHHSSSYDWIGDKYSDFGQLMSTGRGLVLQTTEPGSVIKFNVGYDPSLSPPERMRITDDGHVGIGTETPPHLLSLVGNEGIGEERFFLSIYNNSLSNRCFSGSKCSAGDQATFTSFGHNSENYDVENFKLADFGGIFTNGAGLHFSAGNAEGIIKFLTGSNGLGGSDERMRIASNGYVGIGTQNPAAKLQVTDGDIYIANIEKGVIMTSPDGACWRMTINNDGSIKTSPIACPN